MPRAWVLSSFGFFLAIMLAAAPAAGVEPLPAPYQVDGLIQYRDDLDRGGSGLGLGRSLVAVDLGDAEAKPHPGSERFQIMTVLGTTGVAQGQLEDLGRDCSNVCGDELESCHYRALLALDRPASDLGTPLVALTGRHEPEDYQVVPDLPLDAAPMPALESDSLEPPVWSPDAGGRPAYRIRRWDPDAARVTLDLSYGGKAPATIEEERCDLRRYGPLSGLQCSGLALLAAEQRTLLFSYPDYNMPAAEPVVRFGAGGIDYYLVRLGIKAQTVFGLLFQQDGAWRASFRPRDYALLC